MRSGILFIVIFMSFHCFSNGAVLIEDQGELVAPSTRLSSSSKIYSDAMDLRDKRRVGVGVVTSGAYGLGGVELELNFTAENSLVVGYGGGSGFRSFNLLWRKVVSGQWFLPYLELGFSNWHSTSSRGGSIKETNPAFLGEKFLSDKQKKAGSFSETFVVPAMGLQYVQLKGDWSGASVYAEVNLIVDVKDLQALPNGSVGFLYYF